MDYFLIVKITRKSVCIHYQIGNGAVDILYNEGSSEIPLAFCLNGGELLMNRFASEQARLGAGNAFCDYFDLIKDPYRNFRFAGEDKPIKQLLYYGLESQFSVFLREKVYDNIPIESHRESLPLRFLFADDISNEERQFVIELFLEQGYKNVAEIQITEQLFGSLLSNYHGPVLTLSGIDGDLYASYHVDEHSKAVHTKRISGMGKDQRLSICVDLMLEYINDYYYNPFPSKEDIEDVLLKDAIHQYTNDGGPMICGTIIGPDGETYDYQVMRKDIERNMQRLQGSNSIVSEVKYFLNGIGADTQNTAVVLMDDVNSDYFKDIFKTGFGFVVGVSEHHYKRIWEDVFQYADFSTPIPPSHTLTSKHTANPPPLPPPPRKDAVVPPIPPAPIRGTVAPPSPSKIMNTPPAPQKKEPMAPPLPPAPQKKTIAVPPPPPSSHVPQKKVPVAPPPPISQKQTPPPPPPSKKSTGH